MSVAMATGIWVSTEPAGARSQGGVVNPLSSGTSHPWHVGCSLARGKNLSPGRSSFRSGPTPGEATHMLTIGDKLPEFKMKAVVGLEKGKEFQDLTNTSFKGKWTVLFAWPKDFTFICPTEIAEFGRREKDFRERDAQVLGLSTDSEFVHHAWRTHH